MVLNGHLQHVPLLCAVICFRASAKETAVNHGVAEWFSPFLVQLSTGSGIEDLCNPAVGHLPLMLSHIISHPDSFHICWAILSKRACHSP